MYTELATNEQPTLPMNLTYATLYVTYNAHIIVGICWVL